jgi:tol-pal system protein YbgF
MEKIRKTGTPVPFVLAAFLPMLLMVAGGCATKQDVLRVDERVRMVRNDQKLLNAELKKIDSLITSGGEQDNSLRVDVRSSLDALNNQLVQLQNQISDLQQVVYRLSQRVAEAGTVQQPIAVIPPTDTTTETSDSAETAGTSQVDCRRLWDNAFKDMRRGQHDLAIAGFSDYLKYCPKGDLSDNSQYWIAEAHYELNQFERAIEEFNKLLDEYPDSEKLATVYFKLGHSYEKLGDKDKALEYFLILKNNYPGSVEYEHVKDKISQWEEERKG